MSFKDPKKFAREIFRRYDARVLARVREGVRWVFPDGAVICVPHDPTPQWVTAQARNLAARYGNPGAGDFFHQYDGNARKPTLDLERLVASTHAKERLALMQSQANVTFQEVLHALRLPERVLWSPVHESWCWIRGRIAVAVAESHGTHVITTILWASQELFDENPRPKESA